MAINKKHGLRQRENDFYMDLFFGGVLCDEVREELRYLNMQRPGEL